jgi:hypothetical protein
MKGGRPRELNCSCIRAFVSLSLYRQASSPMLAGWNTHISGRFLKGIASYLIICPRFLRIDYKCGVNGKKSSQQG